MEDNIFTNVWVGLITSFLGGYVLAVFLALNRLMPFLKFKSTGVIKVFKDQKKANDAMSKDIKKSKTLCVLAMKGDTFSNPENPLSVVLKDTGIKQMFLISSAQNPYLTKRATELKIDNMADCVEFSVNNLNTAKKANHNIEIKRHNEVVRFRIILLSDYLYLSFQEVNIPGKKSPILKIEKDSSVYKCFSSLFDDLWAKY